MNVFQDEQGKQINISLTAESINAENEVNDYDQSVGRILAAYHNYINTSDIPSDCSDEELVVDDDDFDVCFDKSDRKKWRLDALKEKFSEVKIGNVEFDTNFDKSFADLGVAKVEDDVDFSTFTKKDFALYVKSLETHVKQKEEEYPLLVAQNVKKQLDNLKVFVEDIISKAFNLQLEDNVTDNARLTNILKLSKSIAEVFTSIESKINAADEHLKTLKIYAQVRGGEWK